MLSSSPSRYRHEKKVRQRNNFVIVDCVCVCVCVCVCCVVSVYLVTRGLNPREHAVKQELVSNPPTPSPPLKLLVTVVTPPPPPLPPQERIRTYMMRVKDITDRKKAARLDKGAATRFFRNALYDAEEGGAKRPGHTPQTESQAKRPKNK